MSQDDDINKINKIKKKVKLSYDYFKHNYDRYDNFRRFVFETSLNSDEKNLLNNLQRPTLEFNIIESFISRLLGEFSKQEPSISVSAGSSSNIDQITTLLVESHLRYVVCDNKNHNTQYHVYKDLLSGGFGVFKMTTNYVNNMSFDQEISYERLDPTMCGFDPLARESHKGDGQFCFEIFPMEKSVFQEQYPEINIDKVNFQREIEGFSWSYLNNNQKIIVVCDFYEKKKTKMKIVQTADNQVMSLSEYNKMIDTWSSIAPPPIIKGKPRTTIIEKIYRKRFIENALIEEEETDFPCFPLIFVDGNSELLKGTSNSNIRQFCRPYAYHAKDVQRLKNFAGNSLANEIENIVQHKFMVAEEALPDQEENLNAYKDIQKANVLIYKAFKKDNPDQPIMNPIREIGKIPAPPEILQAFSGADSLMQMVLGSFDASLGINNNQLSGIAIVEGASQSNAAAMPYIVGYLEGLQRVCEVYVKMFPLYHATPRTIPIRDSHGLKDYIKINQENGLSISYEENDLNVKIEAGVNFRVQQSKALQQLTTLMQASQQFSQFMNEKGLPFLLDNLDIKGIDQIKAVSQEWIEEQKQKQQMAMQMQQQTMMNNPAVVKNQIEMKKLEQDSQKSQVQFQLDMARLKSDQNKVLYDLQQSREQNEVQILKANTEKFAKEVELELKHKQHELNSEDQHHRHAKELHGMVLQMTSKDKEGQNGATQANMG